MEQPINYAQQAYELAQVGLVIGTVFMALVLLALGVLVARKGLS